jgi:hypothetical protein
MFTLGLTLIVQMYPLYINSNTGFGQDPAYQYLFAGVDILLGNAPLHNDHPGTPLQSLIALIIFLGWCGLRALGLTHHDLYDSVLRTPEFFLACTSLSLVALTCLALYYFGARILRCTDSYAMALSCQLTPALYSMVIPNLVFPTPEALLFSVSTLLLAVVTPLALDLQRISSKEKSAIAIVAGVLCGLGVAIKITFFPLVLLLLLLQSPRLIIKAALACCLAWFFGVLPILSRLGHMFEWFYVLLTHSGMHGSGPATGFEWSQLKVGVGWLMGHFSLFYYAALGVTAVLCITLVIRLFAYLIPQSRASLSTGTFKDFTPTWEVLITGSAFAFAMLFQTIIVAKHLGPSYMVPALAVPMLAFIWCLRKMLPFLKKNIVSKAICWGWFFFLVLTAANSISSTVRTISHEHSRGLVSHDSIATEVKKFDNPLVVGAFNCNFLNCARWFGMSLVPSMEIRMRAIDNGFYYYNIFNQVLHIPGVGPIPSEKIPELITELNQQGRAMLLISPPYPHLKRFELETITTTPIQNLYRIIGYGA